MIRMYSMVCGLTFLRTAQQPGFLQACKVDGMAHEIENSASKDGNWGQNRKKQPQNLVATNFFRKFATFFAHA